MNQHIRAVGFLGVSESFHGNNCGFRRKEPWNSKLMFLKFLLWWSVVIILYFYGSAFLDIHRTIRRMEIDLNTIILSIACIKTMSFRSLHLSAWNWKATLLLISSTLGSKAWGFHRKSWLMSSRSSDWGSAMKSGGSDGQLVPCQLHDYIAQPSCLAMENSGIPGGGCTLLHCSAVLPDLWIRPLAGGRGKYQGSRGGRRQNKLHA